MPVTNLIGTRRGVARKLLVVILIFVTSFTGMGQESIKKSKFFFHEDEVTLVHILMEQELVRDSDKSVRALRALTKLCQMKRVRFSETYVELTRFLDFEFVEIGASTQTNLDTHPAMAALYYCGEEALPFLSAVIGKENERSNKSMLALWTVIYIKKADFRLAYAYLSETARHSKTRVEKDRLLTAAKKAAALDPEPPT